MVQGGPNTRVDPATRVGSCLDLFVVSRELEPHVTSLVIDQGREVTVARAVREGGVTRLVHSDHHTCLLTLTDLPRRKEVKERRETMWNLTRMGGWNKYETLTEKQSNKILEIADNDETSIETKFEHFNKIHEKIKFQAFGKLNIKKTKDEKVVYENKSAKEIFDEQTRIAEEEVNKINKAQHSKVGKVWEIKKKIMGNNKSNEANAVKDPKTNKLVLEKEKIKEVTLEYCINTLTSNEPEEDAKDTIENKKKESRLKLNGNEGEFEINKETFDNVVEKFRKSRKRNYDFLVKSDVKFKNAVFKLCQAMMKYEEFPKAFKNTTLHQIFKGGKGKRETLSDNRFIHSKSWFPRLAEALVVQGGMKGPLVEGSSEYQIGGQPGHRPEELMFVIKSVIAKQRAEGKAIILQCWDISKFFDKEMIEDAVLTCLKRKVNPKVVRLWHKLNDNTKIRVQTGSGLSQYKEVGAVVGQGTIGGALVSQAVLDEGVGTEFTPGNKEELTYGEVAMGPCMFQDDLIHGTNGVKEARIASAKVNKVMKKLNLNINENKSICILMGPNKKKKEIEETLTLNPIKCGKSEIKLKDTVKWLGQQMSGEGLKESVAATVEAREGKIRGAALEIASITNDWRAEAAGGMQTALTMWEACIIPSLLQGAGTWTQISPVTERKLNALQHWFIRLVLQLGPGAPIASLGWETGMMDMRLRIWKEKILMVMHLRQLGEGTLASRVYREQVARGWPGLARETREICQKLKIEDCNQTKLTKKDYKHILKKLLMVKDEELLREEASGKQKCDKIMLERYGKKTYISEGKIKDVRQQFKSRVRMLPFAGNFSKDKRFARTEWLCRCQAEREEEGHLKEGNCPVYSDIRADYGDLSDDQELVSFFQRILERRDLVDLQEEQEEEQEEDGRDPALVVGHSTTDVCQTGGQQTPSSGQFSHAYGFN